MSSKRKGKDYEENDEDDIYDKWEKQYKKSAARNSMSLYEFVQEGLKIEKQKAAIAKKKEATAFSRAVKKTTKDLVKMAEQERKAKKGKK